MAATRDSKGHFTGSTKGSGKGGGGGGGGGKSKGRSSASHGGGSSSSKHEPNPNLPTRHPTKAYLKANPQPGTKAFEKKLKGHLDAMDKNPLFNPFGKK